MYTRRDWTRIGDGRYQHAPTGRTVQRITPINSGLYAAWKIEGEQGEFPNLEGAQRYVEGDAFAIPPGPDRKRDPQTGRSRKYRKFVRTGHGELTHIIRLQDDQIERLRAHEVVTNEHPGDIIERLLDQYEAANG